MLLPGVLFVLFLAGCWLYSLTDAALTPAGEFRGLTKTAWIYIIAATFIVGALAWLVARRSLRTRSWAVGWEDHRTLADTDFAWYSSWTEADSTEAAIARHPASQSRQASARPAIRPAGPDDDPDFLRQLDRLIRGTSADPGELPPPRRVIPHPG